VNFRRHRFVAYATKRLQCRPRCFFCDNETNTGRLYGQADAQGFFKDGFDEYVVHGNQSALNPNRTGTKAGVLHKLTIPAGGSTSVRLRLVAERGLQSAPPSELNGRSENNPPTSGNPRRSGLKSALQPFATSTRSSHSASRRPTSFTRICSGQRPMPMRATSSVRRSPDDLVEAVFLLRHRRVDQR